MKKIAVVGAGFSGAVIAERLAWAGGFEVDVFEARDHVAGNCHSRRDPETGVMEHVFGPHIFHTDREEVWDYVRRFADIRPYTHRVKAISGGRVYSLPVNLLTINQFYNATFSPAEAEAHILAVARDIPQPHSFEEQALRFVGPDLYQAFFRGYTLKQWETDPAELPASILKRLPLRFNYEDNYFNHPYQGIPAEGYTAIAEKILARPGIRVRMGATFSRADAIAYDHVFYSGPLDAWFHHAKGRLPYRTLDFRAERHSGDYQGCAMLNYCDEDIPFTRVTEHKHFTPWEQHEKTLIYKEYSRACGPDDPPYYPIRMLEDNPMLREYVALAQEEPKLTFVGRLGTYRYLDMDVTIAEALDCARRFLEWSEPRPFPTFSVNPL